MRERSSSSANLPETSIVIRSFNEERWLPDVFAALDRQIYRDFEVILVDSGSVDRTREIAHANGARIIQLRSEDFTYGHALNLGCGAASGQFVAIISAHAIPADDEWLGELVTPLRNSNTAMVFGSQRGHEVSKLSETLDFERVFPDENLLIDEDHPFANNANSVVARSYWEKYEFDEGLPGLEDIDWAKHWLDRGKEVVYQPSACIIHVHTETWEQVRRRYYREAMAARWVGIRLLRHIPGEILRETYWCLQDYWFSIRRLPSTPGLIKEISRFRYEKTLGTVGGIIDSRGLASPGQRSEMYFRKGFPAVVVRGPQRARIEEKAVPSLKPGEVLIRVSYVGVCNTDLDVAMGASGNLRPDPVSYPIVPGHEFSGTIVAFGSRVTEFTEGDRVVTECIQGCGQCEPCEADDAMRCKERRVVGCFGQDGGYAAYTITRARYVHKIPDEMPMDEAALTASFAAVIKGLRKLDSSQEGKVPRRCVIVGGGVLGQIVARILQLRGHNVLIVDRNPGCQANMKGMVVSVASLDEIGHVDWVVETTGSREELVSILERADLGTSILLLSTRYDQDTTLSFRYIAHSDRTIVSSVGSCKKDYIEALRMISMMDSCLFVRKRYRLDEYEQAWNACRSEAAVKFLLKVDAAEPWELAHQSEGDVFAIAQSSGNQGNAS